MRNDDLVDERLATHRWSLPLFWPYHLGLKIKLGVQRQVDDEPLYDEILPNIFLGAQCSGARPSRPYKAARVTGVSFSSCRHQVAGRTPGTLCPVAPVAWRCWTAPVSCPERIQVRAPTPACLLGTRMRSRWRTWSGGSSGPRASWQRGTGSSSTVHTVRDGGGGLGSVSLLDLHRWIDLAGHGRSAAVLCALLVDLGHAKSVSQGVELMRAARPRVRLNNEQRQAVEAWLEARSGSRLALS